MELPKTPSASSEFVYTDPEYSKLNVNTSGENNSSPVPEEIKGWSWGGFLLSWIWAIGNHVWIGLLALIPFLSLIMQIILGVKGREWAWQSKHWESIEQFKETQKKWAIAGLIIIILGFLVPLVFFIIILIIAVNPQKQIDLARCANNCQNASEINVCLLKCQASKENLIPTVALPTQTPDISPTQNFFSPTPTQIILPTIKPTKAPIVIPTNPISTSNFQSNGVQTLENGITVVVTSASLSSTIVSINVTFKNTSASSQTISLMRIQMHDQTLGEPPKDIHSDEPLASGVSRNFKLSYDILPTPPFRFRCAIPNSDMLLLGTFTP